MVRIQGMKRDVTPGFATALGSAGVAMQGAVNMRGALQDQEAQAQQMAQRDELAQMQRVEFGLATEKLRLGIENARQNMEREKKLRSDARVANTASLRAMQRSGGFDALGPEVRAFHEEAIRLASEMEPEAGAKVVAAAGTMIAKADNDVRRESMLRTVMGSVSTGYWKQAEGVLAEIAGIDLDGDGTDDVSSRKLSDIAEEWTKRLQDPTTDAGEIEQEYRQLRRAVDGALARQEQRLKVYNVLQAQFEEAFSPPPLMGNSAYQSSPMPEGLVAEAKSLLEDWRIGEMGDGPGAEAEAKRSMRALINGNKFLALPDGSPYGDGIEIPWQAWEGMQDRERANLMGVLTGNDVRLRALDMASDHVSKLLSTKTVDPDDAPELLRYYANWYSAALSGAPLPTPPNAATQGAQAPTKPAEMLEAMRSGGQLDQLRGALAGKSEDEKFQLLSAFIDAQSDDDGVRSGLAEMLLQELLP
jgi:hypothetical protein